MMKQKYGASHLGNTVFFCNPKTMGYAHGSKKAEADE